MSRQLEEGLGDSPPHYRPDPSGRKWARGDEEAKPLFPVEERDSLDGIVPSEYPPRATSSGRSDRPNTTYTFVPRWPVKGKGCSAIGALSADKEVCQCSPRRPDTLTQSRKPSYSLRRPSPFSPSIQRTGSSFSPPSPVQLKTKMLGEECSMTPGPDLRKTRPHDYLFEYPIYQATRFDVSGSTHEQTCHD